MTTVQPPPKITTVSEEFKDPNNIGFQILFLFIAGSIGDIFIHIAAELTKQNKTFKFANSLLPYYKSLEYSSRHVPLAQPKQKFITSTVLGAIWGGIACVVALLIAKLFMYFKEIEKKDLII